MDHSIISAIRQLIGFVPNEIKPQGLTRFSTSSRPTNRDGWVRVLPDGIVRFGCWRQGVSSWWRDGDRSHQQASKRDPQAEREALAKLERERVRVGRVNASIWGLGNPLHVQSPVGQYLSNRGLGDLVEYPPALKMTELPYFEDGLERGVFPVMLGAVTDLQGDLMALHRTYIGPDGKKAPVPQPKKLSRASGPVSGAAIKLNKPTIINGKLVLGVAEGIETALACYLASGIPTWSCVSAGGIRSFEWPEGLQSLVVFADNDENGVGQASARDLASRAAAAGLEVRVLVPEIVGTDWLDAYLAGGAAA